MRLNIHTLPADLLFNILLSAFLCSYNKFSVCCLQVNFKGRTIGYRALGRIHSLDELWVYDATAWDIESGIKAKVKHYKESEEAIQDAVKEVITKLTAQGILQD